MQETEDGVLVNLIALTHIPALGPVTIGKLLNHFGSAEAIWKSDPLLLFPYLSKLQQNAWQNAAQDPAACLEKAKQYVKRAREEGITLLSYQDPRYPAPFKTLANAPLVLSLQGNLVANDLNKSIAIVGTRNASHYGLEMAHYFARELAANGFTIISGLARGIDTQAHLGALETGRTVAVLGSGLLRIYPAENSVLSKRITHQGALLSGFSLDAAPDKGNFPQRNHLVAASSATLLIEAPLKSGAMLTAGLAIDQGRPLFALPGKIDQESFQGNLSLLQRGVAKIALHPSDLAHALGSKLESKSTSVSEQSAPLEEAENLLATSLGSQELSIDLLAAQTKLPTAQLNVLLMKLLLKKKIKELPGKRYTCVRNVGV